MTMTLALITVVGSIVGVMVLKRGENLRFETSATAQEVVNVALATAGTGRRWSVLAATDRTATFAYQKKPSLLIGFVLLWFFLVPGILYLVFAGKREALSVSVTTSGTGQQVQVVSNGFRGKLAGRAVRRQVTVAGATAVAPQAHAAVARNLHQQAQ